jgi:plastocyanin
LALGDRKGGENGGMRTVILILALFGGFALAGPAGAATTKTVNIYSASFSPASVSITAGDTVKWVNRTATTRQIYGGHGQFVSPILKKGQSFSFTFNAASTYGYKDELHPKVTGKVTVKGAPPTLTLAASQVYMVYGDKVTLSGVVSDHKAGEQVTIFYQPYPSPNLIQRTVVITTTGGAYSFIVSPQILTAYQASWKGAYATPTSIQVQPKLSIGRNGAWILHAAAGRNFAGKAVMFQRLNSATGQWVTLQKVILNVHSSARVVVTLPKGMNHLRLTMSVNAAGAGFLGAISPELNWVQH